MTTQWAIRLPLGEAAAAAKLRLVEGVEVCAAAEGLWLRGSLANDDLWRELRLLPCDGRFSVDAANRVTPMDAQVPVGRLPEGSWTPIRQYFAPALPPSALPALALRPDQKPALRLVRASDEGAPSLMVLVWDRWLQYVKWAPEARLRPLRLAVSDDRRVIVRGMPLPPVPADLYVESGGMAIRAGYALDPPLDPLALAQLVGARETDLVLLRPDASCEVIVAESFVPASRRSVRRMEAALHDR